MTVTQKQLLLHALGYLGREEVDGLWGPKSAAATRAFQRAAGLTEDGIFGPLTQEAARQAAARLPQEPDFWREVPNFTRAEFACQCRRYCDGYPAEPKERLVRIAQAARDHFGRPALVVSGLRCRQHNANVGGVWNSQHMAGEACDLTIPGVPARELLAFLQSHPGVRYAYRINDANVHFDIPKGGY